MRRVRQVVLFCDIHRFMRAAVALGDRMPAFVQAFYETVGAEAVAGGGAILKYIGDALMAVFPAGGEIDAVRAGLAMRAAFADLAARWQLDPECCLEVGISAGEVTRGVFGHPSLGQDDVMGETVSHAAMLQHHRGVAVTRSVRDAVGDAFATETLPDLPVKFSAEPLASWRIVEG